jgi:hypothetical protein
MSRPTKTEREQLIEARDRVCHQLDVLRNPARRADYTRQSARIAADLQLVLDELEASLAELESGNV